MSLGLDFLVDDEYELLEDDLSLDGFTTGSEADFLLDLLTPLLTFEKAASSIFLLVLVDLLDLEEDLLVELSVFDLKKDCSEGSEETVLLRLADCPLAEGRLPLLVS